MTQLSRPFDAVALTQALIRCPSVTPHDAGALEVLAQAAQALGFATHPLQFEEEGTPTVQNLYARWGTKGPNFCFAGHTDVVPVGEAADWSNDPFAAQVKDGALHGRGAADMKGAIGAFMAAADRFISEQSDDFNGSISLLITGDEEGPAINGTVKMLDWLRDRDELLSHCLVGEPTNPNYLGEMMKVGRRGSIGGSIKVYGTQGHVAYPHLADNPVPKLAQIVARLSAEVLDEGTDHFQPSNLEFTSIDVGNEASNVIPATAEARFNIRFNDQHTGTKLHEWLTAQLDALSTELDCRYELNARISGESFLTEPGPFSDLIADSVQQVSGHRPDQSTTGGTSDARFITNMCPVCEFGLTGQTMHKVDENVPTADIIALADIYYEVLKRYFAWAA